MRTRAGRFRWGSNSGPSQSGARVSASHVSRAASETAAGAETEDVDDSPESVDGRVGVGEAVDEAGVLAGEREEARLGLGVARCGRGRGGREGRREGGEKGGGWRGRPRRRRWRRGAQGDAAHERAGDEADEKGGEARRAVARGDARDGREKTPAFAAGVLVVLLSASGKRNGREVERHAVVHARDGARVRSAVHDARRDARADARTARRGHHDRLEHEQPSRTSRREATALSGSSASLT